MLQGTTLWLANAHPRRTCHIIFHAFDSPVGLLAHQGLANIPADVVHSATFSIQAAAAV
jgi:hypothetical protein